MQKRFNTHLVLPTKQKTKLTQQVQKIDDQRHGLKIQITALKTVLLLHYILKAFVLTLALIITHLKSRYKNPPFGQIWRQIQDT